MRTDALGERLGRDLRPVRPRKPRREAAPLLCLALAEVGILLGMSFMRPDTPDAMIRRS